MDDLDQMDKMTQKGLGAKYFEEALTSSLGQQEIWKAFQDQLEYTKGVNEAFQSMLTPELAKRLGSDRIKRNIAIIARFHELLALSEGKLKKIKRSSEIVLENVKNWLELENIQKKNQNDKIKNRRFWEETDEVEIKCSNEWRKGTINKIVIKNGEECLKIRYVDDNKNEKFENVQRDNINVIRKCIEYEQDIEDRQNYDKKQSEYFKNIQEWLQNSNQISELYNNWVRFNNTIKLEITEWDMVTTEFAKEKAQEYLKRNAKTAVYSACVLTLTCAAVPVLAAFLVHPAAGAIAGVAAVGYVIYSGYKAYKIFKEHKTLPQEFKEIECIANIMKTVMKKLENSSDIIAESFKNLELNMNDQQDLLKMTDSNKITALENLQSSLVLFKENCQDTVNFIHKIRNERLKY